ncbi:hypothetical protein BHM03_00000383 [Ensete ventricosum]|uniref:Uncharacterized protein n=1 Tax=Ensete ventricosum TaxID=4639 RepID=A0A445M8F7_ENSVE|nr:hypothetical protein BHM03_00000383 [Ensete ventricosum]
MVVPPRLTGRGVVVLLPRLGSWSGTGEEKVELSKTAKGWSAPPWRGGGLGLDADGERWAEGRKNLGGNEEAVRAAVKAFISSIVGQTFLEAGERVHGMWKSIYPDWVLGAAPGRKKVELSKTAKGWSAPPGLGGGLGLVADGERWGGNEEAVRERER